MSQTLHDDGPQEQQGPAKTDWTAILSICYQLRVPAVFISREAIQDSPKSRAVADAFVSSAFPLLERLGMLLKDGPITDTYVLRRTIMACAAFTNPKDLWNERNPVAEKTIVIAKDNLKCLYLNTRWSTGVKAAEDKDLESGHSNNVGTFSENVIDILAKVLRPSFANIQAQKAMDRAQLTIETHQKDVQKATKMIEDLSTEPSEKGTLVTTTTHSKDLTTRRQPLRSRPQQRFQIAPVKDTPNEDDWSGAFEDPDRDSSELRWNTNFLESIAIVEWCALQSIEDSSRIQEVFMLLLAPILTLADSISRHRIRGLNLMCQFLIRHHQENPSSLSLTPGADPRIWIRIFERTGLDQVLERALVSILTPLNVSMSSDEARAAAELKLDPQAATAADGLEELEAIRAGFRAYLTLILVNTEPSDKPRFDEDRPSTPGRKYSAFRDGSEPVVSVEGLFVLGVLGGLMRASPSNEFRELILEWMECLVNSVITFDRIQDQMPYDDTLCLESKTGVTPALLSDSLDQKISCLAIYGMGELSTKYLLTLVPYLCSVMEFPLPSSPPQQRLECLKLAGQASDSLRALMSVTRGRVGRFRGQIMAGLSSCWANSRIYPSAQGTSTSTSAKASAAGPLKSAIEMAQARLDTSLAECMGLCVEICRGQGSKIVELGTREGVEQDLKVLQELDMSVFGPLFALVDQ
ncbi:hypothetical protein EMPS_04420 [Entomortierella parvispora]|uniref:Uncharacterized protein n=1 Tax=Entomortierella parvispora TaxID=205924 RepID=A0A9P3H953_9FUNG|nr:hypothetical protein EMPS_04420 [Entomortierella parvispora]